MVDIPTLNKSVQEFRSLIETNNRIRDRQETKRLADIAKADQKLLEQYFVMIVLLCDASKAPIGIAKQSSFTTMLVKTMIIRNRTGS